MQRRKPVLALSLLAALAALILSTSACGGDDDDTVAGDDSPDSTAPPTAPPSDSGDDPTNEEAATGDYEPTDPMLDITSPQAHQIDEAYASDDGTAVHVRYQAPATPCTGAIASVVEDETTVTVSLVTGLHPNAAAMSCIAGVFSYQQTVTLDAPLGDRDLIVE